MKRRLASLVMCWFATSVAAADSRMVHIGMSTSQTETNPIAVWADEMQSTLAENGIKSRVFPGSTLGSELERDEQVILGLLPINVSGGQDVTQYSALLRALRLPFLIRSSTEIDCLVYETEFLDLVNAATRPRGIQVVDVVTVGGMSGLFTLEGPVDTMDKLRSQRIRAMDQYQVDTVESWGASSVLVAWEEVTTALQTSVVDGYLNPPNVPLTFRHTRYLQNMLALDVFAGVRFVTVSVKWHDQLSEVQRQQLRGALHAARQANRAFAESQLRRDMARLQAEGVTITRPDQAFLTELGESVSWLYDERLGTDAKETVRRLLEGQCRNQ